MSCDRRRAEDVTRQKWSYNEGSEVGKLSHVMVRETLRRNG